MAIKTNLNYSNLERYIQEELVSEFYEKRLNAMTGDFLTRFCPGGLIDWEAIVRYNAEARR